METLVFKIVLLVMILDCSFVLQRDIEVEATTLEYGLIQQLNVPQCYNETEIEVIRKKFEWDKVDTINLGRIRLEANNWDTSRMTNLLAATFINNILGYPVHLGLYSVDWSKGGYNAFLRQHEGIVDMNFEIWPDGKKVEIAQYVEGSNGTLQMAAVGFAGQSGWYVPTAALESTKEILEYWRAYTNPEVLNLFPPFGTTESGTDASGGFSCANEFCKDGRYIPPHMIGNADKTKEFYGVYPSFDAGTNEMIIRNLNLNLSVNYLGTKFQDIITNFTIQEQPIIFYYWKPDVFIDRFDFTRVVLPEYKPSCFEDHTHDPTGKVACDYPTSLLRKLFAKSLELNDPPVHKFASKFTISDAQMSDYLGYVAREGMSFENATCAWLRSNNVLWENWVPTAPLPVIEELKEVTSISLLLGILIPLCVVVMVGVLFLRRRRIALSKQVLGIIDFNDLELTEMVGSGSSGEVHKARFRGTVVAVKKLISKSSTDPSLNLETKQARELATRVNMALATVAHKTNGSLNVGASMTSKSVLTDFRRMMSDRRKDRALIADFRTEMAIISKLRHPNVVLFMGSCESPYLCIITEYLPKGSLHDVINVEPDTISYKVAVQFACDIASGMAYLHGQSPPLIHADLKSLNVLVDASYRGKVSDFGLTLIHGKALNGMLIGSFLWMAPETLLGISITEKSDVYSFSIVLWELAIKSIPYSGQWVKTEDAMWELLNDIANNHLRPVGHSHYPKPYRELMNSCWDDDPTVRPSFKDITEKLEVISSDYTQYLSCSGYLLYKTSLSEPFEVMYFVSETVDDTDSGFSKHIVRYGTSLTDLYHEPFVMSDLLTVHKLDDISVVLNSEEAAVKRCFGVEHHQYISKKLEADGIESAPQKELDYYDKRGEPNVPSDKFKGAFAITMRSSDKIHYFGFMSSVKMQEWLQFFQNFVISSKGTDIA